MKRTFVYLLLVLLVADAGAAQEAAAGGAPSAVVVDSETQQRLQLAISSVEYPVTPGDVYRLTYRQADTPVTSDLLVESNYTINMRVFGTMNAAGMTFAKLKPAVEKAVAAAYPRSMPLLAIHSLGVFQVYLKGETLRSENVTAWGLTRLSQIVETRRGPYASTREIRVISRDGTEKVYDLVKASRLGATDQDPYVKSGDTIVLSRSGRSVEIQGEVRRPGTYELVGKEQLREVVEIYGDGLTDKADTSRVRIRRVAGEPPRILYLSVAEGYQQGTPLENGDVITIPSLTRSLPVVSFEGAVIQQGSTGTQQAAASLAAVTAAEAAGAGVAPEFLRIVYTFTEGETLSDALREVRGSLSPLADLSSASVLREGTTEPIHVDLRDLLAKAVSQADLVLKPNDRIVIPYLRFSIFVSGAVENPGSYPYAPGRTYHYYVTLAGGSAQDAPDKVYITDVNGNTRDQKEAVQPEDRIFLTPADITVQGAVFAPGSYPYREGLPITYYINLAGGIDPERNGTRKIVHYDSSGNRREKDAPVMAGDRLYVPNTSFVYNFNRYAPIVTTILTIIFTSMEIFSLWPK